MSKTFLDSLINLKYNKLNIYSLLTFIYFWYNFRFLDSSGDDKGTQAARDSALYVQVVSRNKDGSLDCFTTEFEIPLWIKVRLDLSTSNL